MSSDYIKVIQISDTHLFSDPKEELCGQNTERSFQAVLKRVRSFDWPPDFILATGDISQDKSEASYERFREAMKALNIPVFCCPGNHDDPVIMKKVLTKDVVVGRDVTWGNWQLLLLSSLIPNENGGHLNEEELAFLEEALKKQSADHVLVGLHHSPISVSSQWMDKMVIQNSDAFFGKVDQHSHVRGVLWGHIHQEYEGQRNSISLIGSPSTCVQFQPNADSFELDQKPPGFRWLRLYKNGKIETGVERIHDFQSTVDMSIKGY